MVEVVLEVMLAAAGGVDLMAAEGVCLGAALRLLGTHCDFHCGVLRSCLLLHLRDKIMLSGKQIFQRMLNFLCVLHCQ